MEYKIPYNRLLAALNTGAPDSFEIQKGDSVKSISKTELRVLLWSLTTAVFLFGCGKDDPAGRTVANPTALAEAQAEESMPKAGSDFNVFDTKFFRYYSNTRLTPEHRVFVWVKGDVLVHWLDQAGFEQWSTSGPPTNAFHGRYDSSPVIFTPSHEDAWYVLFSRPDDDFSSLEATVRVAAECRACDGTGGIESSETYEDSGPGWTSSSAERAGLPSGFASTTRTRHVVDTCANCNGEGFVWVTAPNVVQKK